MNIKEIKELIELVNEKQIAELEIDKAGLKLRIKTIYAVEGKGIVISQPSTADLHAYAPQPPEEKIQVAKEVIKEEASETEEDLHIIYSPIVGTFYRAPSPDSAPFVEIGSHVSPGTVLCIIEAMKLMNEIESDIAGEVVKIHQENGKPVEFGQPLFSLRRK
ncbi:MAG: acetyl-CoA carboxylase biotin carboxyl carrier protein [Chloracidobacterium sp.]|nr:acetyl-CoA carboxylase biotin carboxyl carrier protein [Chloracidobacterium sp.]MDW8217322.1 acetyl-CoA carboxylase biotin carboxyl carrier protein [Acidobacteriota bacterium]